MRFGRVTSPPGKHEIVVLWKSSCGFRCTLRRRVAGPPFEISVERGPVLLWRAEFKHSEDAAAFAIQAMNCGEYQRSTSPIASGAIRTHRVGGAA